MTDTQLINLVALEWIENGGDSEGLAWCWGKIRDRVVEFQEANEQKSRHER